MVNRIVGQISQRVQRVVLVDDGCDQPDRERLQACGKLPGVTLIRFDANRGKGFALIAGIREALRDGPDYILTIDSDGQHEPGEIDSFKKFLESAQQPYDLVIGTRWCVMAMPMRSKIGNQLAARLLHAVLHEPIRDTQSGFRAMSSAFARDVADRIRPGHFETEMQVLILAIESHRRIGQMGIETLYLDKNRNSKFRPLTDSLRVLRPLGKYMGVGLASFGLDYTLFLLLIHALGKEHYIVAHAIARLCSAIMNFYANKRLIFRSRNRITHEAAKYVAAVAMSMLAVAAMLFALVEAGFWEELAKPLAEVTVFLFNFLVLKKVVFTTRRRDGNMAPNTS